MNNLGATTVENITGNVQEIVDRIWIKINESVDCCSYKYQILDTFCATQTAVCDVYAQKCMCSIYIVFVIQLQCCLFCLA